MSSENRGSSVFGPLLFAVGLIAALGFTLSFPAVEGLGTKVRLPVFHGAMTWVNLALFSVLAVLAIAVSRDEARVRLRLDRGGALRRSADVGRGQRAGLHGRAQHVGLHGLEVLAAHGRRR